MLNPRLAGRYAKSLVDLATESNQLDAIYKDMQFLGGAIRGSKDLVSLLKSPIVTADKKLAVMDAVSKEKVSDLTASFNRLLIRKGREGILPEIIHAFIDQYKAIRGIHVVKLTTAAPISEELSNEIKKKIREENKIENIELQTKVNPDIIGGFVLELDGTLVDASISYDLNVIKKQFLNNDFIYKVR